jgi:hypothetical protein
LNNTIISSIDKCSVGWYISEILKFIMSDTFLIFQNLS